MEELIRFLEIFAATLSGMVVAAVFVWAADKFIEWRYHTLPSRKLEENREKGVRLEGGWIPPEH